nr:threonylcarbamoyl-AMP synthase [Clostridia bacterium]
MQTKILPIDKASLKLSRDIILNGGTVAFPTETVYGLGANAFDEKAVKSIFKVKGRPTDNPLIVHVHKRYDISKLVSFVPEYAKKLIKKFLPGPLTLVFKSENKVSEAVSCGLDTLAIRIPSHKGAQKFLKFLNLPIAAPSANISKHVSPVSAQHVFADLNGKIELILEGGKSEGGIESTVLDCTGEVPTILRSGLVTREMIESVTGVCNVYKMKEGEAARSPGMKYKHYSPNCKTLLFSFDEREKAVEEYKKQTAKGVKTYIMCDGMTAKEVGVENVLNLGNDETEIASNLYTKLREGEIIAQLIIAISPKKQDGIMVGVMN